MGAPPLTTLAVALAGVTMLGFDTAPFIYFVERHPAYIDLLRDMFQRVDASAIIGYSSVITITEVLTRPMALGNAHLVNEYRSLLLNSRNFVVLPIDAVIAEKAAELRARYRLRTPDALQLAVAIQAGCEAFVTNDIALQRVTDLRILILEDLEQ